VDARGDGLKRLMALRVVFITTLLLVAIYVETFSETLLPVNPLYFLIAGTYALTILYALSLRLVPAGEAQVYIQTVPDLLTVTGLVYLTGGTGTEAGFMLLYPLSVLSGSILLSRRGGLLLAALAALFYTAMVWAVRTGVVPPRELTVLTFMPLKQVLYSTFVTAVSCGSIALIGSYLSTSLKDVGQRLEQAAEQVADLQELQQVMVRSIHSGLIMADIAGRIVYMNEFAEALLAVKNQEARGRTLREVLGSPLLDAAAVQARVASDQLSRFELQYRCADGTPRELGASVSPLAIAEPGQGGYLLIFQDLTDIKRLEREVRTKEKLAAVGEMAAHLAHEIRNPLGSISGSAQVLLSEPNISPEQEQLLRIITKESRRLSETLNRFLFQARPSLPPSGPIDLGVVIGEAVTLLRNGSEVRPDHRITFERDEGPHVCRADPDQITQVFWNLVRNGLEAMPDGGSLTVSLRGRGPDLVLQVRDQGRGMDHDEQRHLFEPFQSSSPMGTGLGLAIVYRIVREHNGDISIGSVPGQGTSVEVRLPRVPLGAPVGTALGAEADSVRPRREAV
jgi:two-component system sensor histidine kinase PilS (NtrC family)